MEEEKKASTAGASAYAVVSGHDMSEDTVVPHVDERRAWGSGQIEFLALLCYRLNTWFCVPVYLGQGVAALVFMLVVVKDSGGYDWWTPGLLRCYNVHVGYFVVAAFFVSGLVHLGWCFYKEEFMKTLKRLHNPVRWTTFAVAHSLLLMPLVTVGAGIRNLVVVVLVALQYAGTMGIGWAQEATFGETIGSLLVSIVFQCALWVLISLYFFESDRSDAQRGLYGSGFILSLVAPLVGLYRFASLENAWYVSRSRIFDDRRHILCEIAYTLGSVAFHTAVGWQLLAALL